VTDMTPAFDFVIPAKAADADALAGELGGLATAVEWKRAAIVYARVLVREHAGRPEEMLKTAHYLSPRDYALLGIHGLRSANTVRAYWRAWDDAITEGLAEPVALGDEVTLPDAEWHDYYTPQAPGSGLLPPAAEQPQRESPHRDETLPRFEMHPHARTSHDGLGLGECPPRASSMPGQSVSNQPTQPQPRPTPVDPNLASRKMLLDYLRQMEQAGHDARRYAHRITEWGQTGETALKRIERIHGHLADIQQRMRDGDPEAAVAAIREVDTDDDET
jgi:hypothetical protein